MMMLQRDFVYWLQGMFELTNPTSLDEKQTDLIRRHLALVFQHDIDPQAGPQSVQDKLNEIHGPSPSPHPNAHLHRPSPAHDVKIRC